MIPVIAAVIMAAFLAASVLSVNGVNEEANVAADSGSVSDLKDMMENATDDIEIDLTGNFTNDLLLVGGDTAINVTHNYNITIIGGDALVTKTGSRHFNIVNSGSGTIRFENLVLTGGAANTGGMLLTGGNYEFENCEFRGLTRTAIVFSGSNNDASFAKCTFQNNTARAITLAGGASASNLAEYTFADCLFIGNTVTNEGGGAIRITASHFAIDITGSAFIENKAIGTGTTHGSNNTVDGGAIYASVDPWWTNGALNIYDSYFEKNFAQDDGGAIEVIGKKTVTGIISNIVNSTFFGNTVAGAHYGSSIGPLTIWCTDGSGGAINYFGMTESEITHCTFYDNGITNALPPGVTGSNWGSVGGGGAIAVDSGEGLPAVEHLPPMPKLTNNIFVGNYVIRPMTQGNINLLISAGLFPAGMKDREKTGNIFVLPKCDRDYQWVTIGSDPRMFQNNGNIGYDNGKYDTDGNPKTNNYLHVTGGTPYSNGISLSEGIQVKNIFADYNNTANRGDPNTALPTPYGDPVGAAGSTVLRQCFIPSPTSNELYRGGSVPYVVEVPYDTLGNVRDTFPNAGAVEIYWTMFNPGTGANWTSAVPTEVENPDNPSETFLVIQSLAFATNNSYYVMTATGIPGDPSGLVNAMPRSAIEHSSPFYGFMGWRSSIPDLDWGGYADWATANGHTEPTVQSFLATHPLSDLPKDAFPLYQPGDVVLSEKQILKAEWLLDHFRVDFDLNCDTVPVWYNSSEPGKEAPRINIPEGDAIYAPLDPLRSGYRFVGWYKEPGCVNAWDFANDAVTEDIVLYAKWQRTWDVTFVYENGDADDVVTVDDGDTVGKPADPSRSGYRFNTWYNGATEWDFSDAVTGDLVLTADWIKTWTVTFVYDNGDPNYVITVDDGDPVGKPADPTRSGGYRFNTWFNGSVEWDFDSDVVTDDTTLTAQWIKTWEVTFVYGNGDANDVVTVDDGDVVGKPADPSRSGGYRFDTWYNGATEWNFSDAVTGDLVLTADWIKTWTVTFVYGNGDADIVIVVDDGALIARPGGPLRNGYSFEGWFNGTAEWDFDNDAVNGDLILYADWEADAVPDPGHDRTWWIVLGFLALIFLLIFLDDFDEEVYGKVTENGEGVEGVTVAYTLNGVKKTVKTDKDGDYSITVKKGDNIEITDVAKDDLSSSDGLQTQIVKERTQANFVISKKK